MFGLFGKSAKPLTKKDMDHRIRQVTEHLHTNDSCSIKIHNSHGSKHGALDVNFYKGVMQVNHWEASLKERKFSMSITTLPNVIVHYEKLGFSVANLLDNPEFKRLLPNDAVVFVIDQLYDYFIIRSSTLICGMTVVKK